MQHPKQKSFQVNPVLYINMLNLQAGQWIDMVIPDVDTVGGFSICNSPQNFKDTQEIHLAVKSSEHPPAHWIHNTVN